MQFLVEIALGNQAMSTSTDVADALEKIAANLKDYPQHWPLDSAGLSVRNTTIMDANDNQVGTWWIDDDEPADVDSDND